MSDHRLRKVNSWRNSSACPRPMLESFVTYVNQVTHKSTQTIVVGVLISLFSHGLMIYKVKQHFFTFLYQFQGIPWYENVHLLIYSIKFYRISVINKRTMENLTCTVSSCMPVRTYYFVNYNKAFFQPKKPFCFHSLKRSLQLIIIMI